MPNHVHGILWIVETIVGEKNFSPLPRGTSKTIGSIVRGFKIGVTKIMRENGVVGPVWQRTYFEHIIRDDNSLHRIRHCIAANPVRWAFDRENPAATTP